MGHEENRSSPLFNLFHLVEALFLELLVPYGEHLINDQDIGVEMGGDGESQSDLHAA